MRLRGPDGDWLPLAEEIGRGGEGTVYALRDRPDVAVKVYRSAMTADRCDKIVAMARLAEPDLLDRAAWPTGLAVDERGKPRGLLMPRIADHREIHLLYSPRSRKSLFPRADFPFLVLCGIDLCRAIGLVHRTGCVIGDVNHASTLVSARGTARLIDCDSFQVPAGHRLFPCEVGVDIFTPPELQGRSFAEVRRSVSHDAFGLAVLLFLLLFQNRHPFAGRFLDEGDMTIGRAIAEGRFVFGAAKERHRMVPPPHSVPLDSMGPAVAALFERAFALPAEGTTRPGPREWEAALATFSSELVVCDANGAHAFHRSNAECPWCRVERSSGVLLFAPAQAFDASEPPFDIDAAWRAVEAVDAPPAAELPPEPEDFTAEPSPDVRRKRRRLRRKRSLGWSIVVLSAAAPLLLPGFGLALPAAFVALIAFFLLARARDARSVVEAERVLEQAELEWYAALARYRELSEATAFHAARREAETARDRLRQQPEERRRGLEQLKEGLETRAFRHFLESRRIATEGIRGLAGERVAHLAAFGVETAWDIQEGRLLAVPGLDQPTTDQLLDWRRTVEGIFRFAGATLDATDVEALDRGLYKDRQAFRRSLAEAPARLRELRARNLAERPAAMQDLDWTVRQVARSRADLAHIRH